MPFYEKGDVCIHYEETGSGFPLLLIPGGGLNSTIGFFTGNAPFNPIEEFQGEYRVIAADLRNANGGESSGPLAIDRPWDAYADDQLGVMDHLGIGECMVMGFCIGGPFIWNLLQRAPERIGFCRKFAFEAICSMISLHDSRCIMGEHDDGDQF
jgi:pimeloyl-ACP methyl ester carboxylesterase